MVGNILGDETTSCFCFAVLQDGYNARAAIELFLERKRICKGAVMLRRLGIRNADRDTNPAPDSRSRRDFLTTTGLLAAAAAAPRTAAALAHNLPAQSGEKTTLPGTLRKIPIGVFDPAFPKLSTDEMIDKLAGWGVEAVEIGTGGYPVRPIVR